MNTAGSGWTTARLSIQGSRGRTQQIVSASTSLPRSQTDRISGCLARAHDHELRGSSRSTTPARRPGSRCRSPRGERRRCRRRDAGFEVVGIDQPGGSGDRQRRTRCRAGMPPGRWRAAAPSPGRSRRRSLARWRARGDRPPVLPVCRLPVPSSIEATP